MRKTRLAFTLAIVTGMNLFSALDAHATACPMGVLCDSISLNLKTTQLTDGRWQYDYSVKDLYYPYDPGAPTPPSPISVGYTFAGLRLPYFADAGITGLGVGSQYAATLTVTVENEPLGEASQSIVVSAGDHPINTQSPVEVISGVNSLLTFVSDYAPVFNAPATVSLVNTVWDGAVEVFKTPLGDPTVYPRLSTPVGMPASPLALVPEADTVLLAVTGLLALMATRRRRASAALATGR